MRQYIQISVKKTFLLNIYLSFVEDISERQLLGFMHEQIHS